MIVPSFFRFGLTILIFKMAAAVSFAGNTFRVAAYNVENYLDVASGTRSSKSAEAKAKVREGIKALNADVLSLEEMGGTNALMELRASLKTDGVDYPYWEHITGYDTNIHVAVLSKFPISARRSHTNDNFLLNGRRFQVSRGFLEVDIQVNPKYSFTLLGAHLKSMRPVPEADESELRLEEAKLLREKITACLAKNINANLVVLGDFNDTTDSKPIRTLIGGRGKNAMVDTRPAERNGDNLANSNPRYEPRNITWTHYFGKEDSYSRIDYILLSHGMEKEWVPAETYVLAQPNWGLASDHRPIVAAFSAEEK